MSAAAVSVVVPCYRCAGSIRRAVLSVAAQTAKPRELILVDDASGDDTLAALHAIRRELGADWVRVIALAENKGAGTARNAGWEAATGEYVAFLDADDAWHPRKLELQLAVMRAQPELALLAHRHVFDDQRLVEETGIATTLVTPQALLWSNRFVTPSVLIRRNVSGRFREAQRYMEDHLLWMQLALRGHRIALMDAALVTLYKPAFGAAGLSADLVAMEQAELENYRLLWREGHIGAARLAALWLWSAAKFVRRLLLVAARGLRR